MTTVLSQLKAFFDTVATSLEKEAPSTGCSEVPSQLHNTDPSAPPVTRRKGELARPTAERGGKAKNEKERKTKKSGTEKRVCRVLRTAFGKLYTEIQ